MIPGQGNKIPQAVQPKKKSKVDPSLEGWCLCSWPISGRSAGKLSERPVSAVAPGAGDARSQPFLQAPRSGRRLEYTCLRTDEIKFI